METIKVKISQIRQNSDNPRIIRDEKFEKLVKSISEFPEMLNLRPIIVDSEMIVLGGNMRLKACKEAGLKEIPVIIADNLTKEQQSEFMIKDNLNFGEWDYNMLGNEWDKEILSEWGLEVLDTFDATQEKTKTRLQKNTQTIKFELTEEQAEQFATAISISANLAPFMDTGNGDNTGNAVARIMETFITQNI